MRYTGSTTIEWPGMVSVYAVLGPHPKITTTGAHQVGIDFGGHRGLVREIDGRAERHDAEPGSVYVTGSSPIRWLEVTDATEALEIYPDQAMAERLAGGFGVPAQVRPSFAVRDGVVFAVASRLRRAHLATGTGTLTDIEASTLAHLLVRHLLRRYGAGPAPRPSGELRPGAVNVVAEYTRAHLGDVITLDVAGRGGQPEPLPLRPGVPRDDRHDAARLRPFLARFAAMDMDERDRMFTERLREEAAGLGLRVIDVDVTMTEGDLAGQVTRAFGL